MIKTKKGMASLYLVAFTTLLLGILTMSFARVMLSESKESSNSDLSQSAYDSALAGIEDAKTAIVMYNSCLGDKSLSFGGLSCASIIDRMENLGFKQGSCDVVSAVLNRGGGNYTGEVEIKDNKNQPNELAQAYTCVTIANDSMDYRSVLNESVSARTIPVRVTNDDYDDIVAFELKWYSAGLDDDRVGGPVGFMPDNSNIYTNLNNDEIIPFANRSVATESLPVVGFEIFQTDKGGFKMHELDLNNEKNTGTDRASIVLYPNKNAENGNYGTFVDARSLLDASNKDSQVALRKGGNSITPKLVSCDYNSNFRCRATIALPATYGNGSDDPSYIKGTRAEETFIVRVSLPYSSPKTDFSVRPCTSVTTDSNGTHCNSYATWTGSQFIVDSTGRASTLYRRITARIDAINTVFIYPDYAVQSTGNDATIEKNLWVTNNCWATDGEGNSSTCANNGTPVK